MELIGYIATYCAIMAAIAITLGITGLTLKLIHEVANVESRCVKCLKCQEKEGKNAPLH